LTNKAKTFWKQVFEVGLFIAWTQGPRVHVWAAATGLGQVIGTIGAHGTEIVQNQTQLDDHEQRLRRVERDMQQVVTDVRWIRQTLEQRKDHNPQ